MGSIPKARPRSLAEVQALLHSNGDTSNEWDQLLTTCKSIAEANTDSSILGWECHHTHFEQEEPGQPQCSQQDCGPGPPREGTRNLPRCPWLGEGSSMARVQRGSLEQTPVAAQKSPSDYRVPSHHLQLLPVLCNHLSPSCRSTGTSAIAAGSRENKESSRLLALPQQRTGIRSAADLGRIWPPGPSASPCQPGRGNRTLCCACPSVPAPILLPPGSNSSHFPPPHGHSSMAFLASPPIALHQLLPLPA